MFVALLLVAALAGYGLSRLTGTRMFFDFQVDGRVHTAAWTVTVG